MRATAAKDDRANVLPMRLTRLQMLVGSCAGAAPMALLNGERQIREGPLAGAMRSRRA